MHTINRTSTAAFILAFVILSALAPAGALSDEDYEHQIQAINARYQSVYDSAEKEGNDIQQETRTCIIEGSIDMDWELTRISFDVPEVRFKNREMSFHTVKTTFINKVIAKTKVPKTYFEIRNLGFGIKTKVPVIRWEIEEISTKVPEFTWDKTSFSTKIPEFKSKRIEWKFHILKIKKLRSLDIPCKDEKERAEKLSESVQAAANRHRTEVNTLTAQLLATKAETLVAEMIVVEKEFDSGLASMDAGITDVRSNGIDPAGVAVEFGGQPTTMPGARAMMAQQKADALATLRAAHQQILDSINALAPS